MFFAAEGRHEMERRFPINHSRGQLREVEAERRRQHWLPFFSQHGSVMLLKTNWLLISLAILWSIRRWAWLYRTVFITYISRYNCYCNYCYCYYNFFFLQTITHLFVCRSNDGTCEVSWKMLCSALWKRVEGL